MKQIDQLTDFTLNFWPVYLLVIVFIGAVSMAIHYTCIITEKTECIDGKTVTTYVKQYDNLHETTIYHTDATCKVVDGVIYSIKEK